MDVKGIKAYFSEYKKRAILSVIGIAIGVFSLTLMSGISGAMKQKILKVLGNMGARVIVVIPGDVKNLGGRTIQLSFYPTLTLSDAKAIETKCPNVLAVSPYKKTNPNVHYGGKKISADVYGVSPKYLKISDQKTICGRFISEDDVSEIAQVAVLGYEVAEELYGEECPVGKTIYLYNAPYRIVGIMEKRGTDLSGENLDSRVYIPISSAVKRISNVDYIDGIYILPEEGTEKNVMRNVTSLLLKRHGKKDFTVNRFEDVVNTQKQAMEIFSRLSMIVAAISFGVGSLGILAVMTLSVYERLVEIGIRRAFGATRKTIFVQFLFESVLLSLSGASSGAIFGVALTTVISHFAGWGTYVPLQGVAAASFLSIAIGIFSGIYPAYRATSFEAKEILKEE